MLILLVSISVVALTVWVFHRNANSKKPHLDIIEMEWSPLNIEWLEEIQILGEDQLSISHKAGRTPHTNQKGTPCFSEVFDELSGFSDTEPDIVCQKPNYFAFSGPVWKQNHSENGTIALRSPVSPSNRVLEAGDSNVFMAQRSEGSVLPPH